MYVVQYSGAFGFIKPWTAVRDSETFSQQFLTPSIVEGIEKKLFPELLETHPSGLAGIIQQHRLSYGGISKQQEQTQPRAVNIKQTKSKEDKNLTTVTISRSRSILTRGVMIEPILWLGFAEREFAERASVQHICLCRNEDILLPTSNVIEVCKEEFDEQWDGLKEHNFNGFELVFDNSEQHGQDSFLVGFNRFKNAERMFGALKIVGNPIREVNEV